jgi:hypothetical protein
MLLAFCALRDGTQNCRIWSTEADSHISEACPAALGLALRSCTDLFSSMSTKHQVICEHRCKFFFPINELWCHISFTI